MKSKEFEQKHNKFLNNPRHANKKHNTIKKSKHSHCYVEVILLLKRQNGIDSNLIEEKAYRTRICVHCGKIHGIDLMESFQSNNGRFYISLERSEMFERYPNHLRFDLGDKVYKSYADIDDEKFIDIRNMYKEQVEKLVEGYTCTDEDITYGILNTIKPSKMAENIKNTIINKNDV
jgi:hypothetical protein